MKASYNSRLDFIFAKIGFTILQQLFRAIRAWTALKVNLKMPSTPSDSALNTCHGSPPDVGYEEFHPEIVFETVNAACEFMRMSINRSQDFMKPPSLKLKCLNMKMKMKNKLNMSMNMHHGYNDNDNNNNDNCQCKISLPTQVYMLVYEYLGYRR